MQKINVPANTSLLGKLLRLPLSFIPKGKIVPLLGTIARGKKWVFGSGTHSQWLGIHEIGKIKKFQKTVLPGSVIYDIGANVGIYSIISSLICGEKGHVFSFEPDPRNLHFLKQHVSINKLLNVTIIESAVSNIDDMIFFDDNDDHCTGHISESGKIQVNSCSLDKFVFEDNHFPPTI
jgi:FkbM family methyltransferase